MYKRVIYYFCLLFLSVLPVAADKCRVTTPELAQMEVRRAYLIGPQSRRVVLQVHVADESNERAGGFQNICPQVAEHTSILFLFETSHVPSFHMSNVHMPLDIAFIDDAGVIRDVQTMMPYVIGKQSQQRLWRPPTPVMAALEVRAGLLGELGVSPGEWSITLEN